MLYTKARYSLVTIISLVSLFALKVSLQQKIALLVEPFKTRQKSGLNKTRHSTTFYGTRQNRVGDGLEPGGSSSPKNRVFHEIFCIVVLLVFM